MSLTVNPTISFKGNNDDKRVSASEVGVATGATVGGAKYSVNAFKRFKLGNTRDIVNLSNKTVQEIKEAANAGAQVKSLWGRIAVNAKKYKNAIIEFAQKSRLGKRLKPVFESKAFAKVSGAIGGLGALFVFISGIGEMGKTFGKLAED